jgi:hypothetical protein
MAREDGKRFQHMLVQKLQLKLQAMLKNISFELINKVSIHQKRVKEKVNLTLPCGMEISTLFSIGTTFHLFQMLKHSQLWSRTSPTNSVAFIH